MIGWNEDIKKTFGACGENVYIGNNVMFARPDMVFLDDNVRIDPFTYVGSGLVVDKNVQICSHNIFVGRKTVYLKGWNFVAYNCKLITASEDFIGNYGPVNDFFGNNKVYEGDIVFEKYSGICTDVIVMPDTKLLEGTVFGAKSFVNKKHKAMPYELWMGNPLVKHCDRNKKIITEKAKEWQSDT